MAAVFLSNTMLTQWSDQGKVRLEDTTLTLLQENRTVKLKPAVRFTKTIDDSADPNSLIGKVKTKEQLDELKAEHYLDSVILGDTGYQVIEGFLGDLSPPPKTAKAEKPAPKHTDAPPKPVDVKPAAPAPEAPPKPASTSASGNDLQSDLQSEAEALSELFLKTVKS